MRRGALAALLLLSAAPAAAGWRSFPASEPNACAGGELFVFSGDGWHYACAQKNGGPDQLIRDGVSIATLRPGQLSGGFAHESRMSANGRVILHQLAMMDGSGVVTGVAAAINGNPVGKVFSDVGFMALADNGADLAYTGQAKDGWRVVTAAAMSGPLPTSPTLVGLGSNGRVAYLVQMPSGAPWFYVNHKPVSERDLYNVAVAPDMKRRVVLRSDPEREGVTVDAGMGAKPEGPWMGAGSITFAPDGRRYAYTARTNPSQYDVVVLNGARHACPEPLSITPGLNYSDSILFSDKGSAAWVCRGKLDTLYLEGKKVVSFSGTEARVAFTPGGKPGVLVVKGSSGAVLMGEGVAVGLPRPLTRAPLGFDAEDEFHYYALIDGQVQLVCGAFGDKSPRACARKAVALYRPR